MWMEFIRCLYNMQPSSLVWLNLHRGCQLLTYVVRVIGWTTGMYLGQKSVGVSYNIHKNIGIALFVLATAQVLVAFVRPGKEKKTKPYFKAFHYLVGYSTIAIGIANLIEGFRILRAKDIWMHMYVAVISFLGLATIFLEVIKWYKYLKQKMESDIEKEVTAPSACVGIESDF